MSRNNSRRRGLKSTSNRLRCRGLCFPVTWEKRKPRAESGCRGQASLDVDFLEPYSGRLSAAGQCAIRPDRFPALLARHGAVSYISKFGAKTKHILRSVDYCLPRCKRCQIEAR